MSGFKICDSDGFQVTFANGLTVSVQFGSMHYCDNRNCKPRAKSPGTSKNAEVAVFESKASGAWRTKEVWLKLFGVNLSDDVVGHVTPEEVAVVMAFVSKMVS